MAKIKKPKKPKYAVRYVVFYDANIKSQVDYFESYDFMIHAACNKITVYAKSQSAGPDKVIEKKRRRYGLAPYHGYPIMLKIEKFGDNPNDGVQSSITTYDNLYEIRKSFLR